MKEIMNDSKIMKLIIRSNKGVFSNDIITLHPTFVNIDLLGEVTPFKFIH